MPNEDFKRTVETLSVPLALADATGTITFANAAFAKLAGAGRGPLDNMSLVALFAPGDRKRIQQAIARVGDGKAASVVIEAQVALGEEDAHWVEVSVQPALDARDRAAGVVVALHDIGQQRETERALNLSAARILALAETSPVPAMIENAEGEVEIANEAFCRALGLQSAPQSLTGMPVTEVLDGHAGALERLPIVVDDVAVGAVWRAREGSSAKDPSSAQGAAEFAVIEKVGMELSVAMEGISAIAIRAQQLEFDPALVEAFQRIRTSTETALAAVGDLVDFSTVTGGVVLDKKEFSLREAIANLVERVGTNAEERGCRLRIRVEQDVADRIEGDVGRLELVLKNLLDNAFLLMPGGEITLQITPEYVTEHGIQLSFSVIVSPEGAQQPTPKISAEAGMGVAVAKFMVAAMGGKLAVASRPVAAKHRVETTADALYAFTIEFPVRAAPPQPSRPTYVSLVALPALIVSGEPEQRLALSNLLRGWRMMPLEADNAAMAMALLERLHQEGSPVPLVLLSNRLPVQDGFILAFRIKHHRRFASTLVMMLATGGKPGDAIACRENGIVAYMRYPINDRQLNEAIVAVTGASVDIDVEETPTLVTRHSLREQRKGGTVLLVDPSRDSQILAAHILGRHDCSVVVAHDLDEALASLDQDVYDIVLVDTSLPGLGGGDAAQLLRSRISRDPQATKIVATSLEHSPAFQAAKTSAGFDATLAKPFKKEPLLQLVGSLARIPVEAD